MSQPGHRLGRNALGDPPNLNVAPGLPSLSFHGYRTYNELDLGVAALGLEDKK